MQINQLIQWPVFESASGLIRPVPQQVVLSVFDPSCPNLRTERKCHDLSGTGPTFSLGGCIIPAWLITHSESAKAFIQATCPSIRRMMTRLGTRPHRHALT